MVFLYFRCRENFSVSFEWSVHDTFTQFLSHTLAVANMLRHSRRVAQYPPQESALPAFLF